VTPRSKGDEDLDETLEETFPASDAPANTVETGIRVHVPDISEVIDNREHRRHTHVTLRVEWLDD
jgi:hypothetical protein